MLLVRRLLLLLPLLVLGLAPMARAEQPTQLRIGIILSSGLESAWDGTFIDAVEAAKTSKPHGLDITYRYSDPLWGDDAGNAMRLYAESGQFDIIWAHSTYSDQVKALKDEFPNIMFVVVGSGNEGLGGNQYWVYKRVHEPAYLLGVLAGKVTKSNVLGVVGTFPADDVNDEINAFAAGARSVNPAATTKVAFIESWYDPAKAAEYTNAQIAIGADAIFSLAGNFTPCEEAAIPCFANFRDDSALSPAILSSAVANWAADIDWIIGEWFDSKSSGTAFEGNTEMRWISMKDGGSDVAPFRGRETDLPADAIAAFDTAKAAILDGSLTVPLDVSQPAVN